MQRVCFSRGCSDPEGRISPAPAQRPLAYPTLCLWRNCSSFPNDLQSKPSPPDC